MFSSDNLLSLEVSSWSEVEAKASKITKVGLKVKVKSVESSVPSRTSRVSSMTFINCEQHTHVNNWSSLIPKAFSCLSLRSLRANKKWHALIRQFPSKNNFLESISIKNNLKRTKLEESKKLFELLVNVVKKRQPTKRWTSVNLW